MYKKSLNFTLTWRSQWSQHCLTSFEKGAKYSLLPYITHILLCLGSSLCTSPLHSVPQWLTCDKGRTFYFRPIFLPSVSPQRDSTHRCVFQLLIKRQVVLTINVLWQINFLSVCTVEWTLPAPQPPPPPLYHHPVLISRVTNTPRRNKCKCVCVYVHVSAWAWMIPSRPEHITGDDDFTCYDSLEAHALIRAHLRITHTPSARVAEGTKYQGTWTSRCRWKFLGPSEKRVICSNPAPW